MNILQIVPNRGWGGGEKFVWDLSDSLSAAGVRVSVIIASGDPFQRDRFAHLDAYTVPHSGLYGLGMIRALARLIRDRNIQIVHTHIFKHAMAALLARKWYGLDVKVIMTRHLGKPGKRNRRHAWMYKQLDRIIFVADWVKEAFLSSGPAVDESKLEVVYNSVREIETEPEFDLRKDLDISPDRFVIGYAGTLMKAKGLDFLIDLADCLREPVFVLAGSGEEKYEQELKLRIRERQLEPYFRFLGRIQRTIPFFRQVNAVIVPSKLREAFPLVVLEAMMAERPVFFSENIPPESITETEGFPIRTDDVPGSADTIRRVMENKELRDEKAAKGAERFREKFSYPVFLDQMIRIYKELLSR